MTDPYPGREQTKAKHSILQAYLEKLAFKILWSSRWSELTFVDGFSGPWETRTDDHADSSFMNAIHVLKRVQQTILDRQSRQDIRKTIRCFFSEKDQERFGQLESAVRPHHDPSKKFLIETYYGSFEDALPEIEKMIGKSFALIFIDPTGWTGFSLPILARYVEDRSREVLITFMYDYINRFIGSSDPKTIESLGPIFGDKDWKSKLPLGAERGPAALKLFRDNLKKMGNFKHVTSTRINKPTANRPHYFLVYGTKSENGLSTFREVEANALKAYDKICISAKFEETRKHTGMDDVFAGHDTRSGTYESMLSEQKKKAEALASKLITENFFHVIR